jgi:hypothetical protein
MKRVTETLLINEQFVSQFKYWRSGQVRTGMRFRNNLFECVSQFKQNQRPQAFELAWQLTQAGKESIVTTSTSQYTVWVNLRTVDNGLFNQSDVSSIMGAFDRPVQDGTLLQAILSV